MQFSMVLIARQLNIRFSVHQVNIPINLHILILNDHSMNEPLQIYSSIGHGLASNKNLGLERNVSTDASTADVTIDNSRENNGTFTIQSSLPLNEIFNVQNSNLPVLNNINNVDFTAQIPSQIINNGEQLLNSSSKDIPFFE